ncbi:MAG TPA: carbon monoxide dehydrogenase accessory protein CooC [Methanosarcina sp.]|nr:carbon monoxide dehydrogenase accessory protein CooC [Methanosarcina sp.]
MLIKIAITGKGGVGKTTLSGTLARLLARDGYEVLAIDADPDMNLASSLGVEKPPKPLTDFKDLIQERAGTESGAFIYNPKVDDITDKYGAIGPDGVRMLVMGTVDKGGSGCMCPASSFLRALLRHLMLKEKSAVILDMEAGIEHLGRGTTRGMDLMIVVVEPGARSLETAERIKRLSSEIGIKHLAAVINKGGSGKVNDKLEELGIQILGEIPFDQKLMQADLEKRAPIEVGGDAVDAISKIKEKLIEMVEEIRKEEEKKKK